MGYLFLLFALAGGLIKGFTGKRVSNDVHTLKDCFFVNFLRLLFCALIGAVFLLFETGFRPLSLSHLPVYLISGISMAAFCVIYMFGYKTAAYMYLSVFGMLGSVITGLLGHFVYGEPLSAGKLIGMAVLVAAVAIMGKYNKSITLRQTSKILPLLILAAVSAAFSDFSQKIFVYEIGGSAATYNFFTYGFAAILLLPAVFLAKGNLRKDSAPLLQAKSWLLCLLIAAALFMNSLFKTMAANLLTAAEIYPVLQGANLIASAVLAQLLLKEKITPRCLLGMAVAFAGLLCMYFG